ncbi:MAG: hypothetical protein ACTHU0_13330 [Kofleriaceae bacterium]
MLLLGAIPGVARGLAALAVSKSERAFLFDPAHQPRTAMAWLTEELLLRRLPMPAIMVRRETDAYHRDERVIVLSEHTAQSTQPAGWAAAAHELARAHLAYTRPRLAWISFAGRFAVWFAVSISLGLGLGAVLYGYAALRDLALGAAGLAVVLGVPRLIEEAWAITFVRQMLWPLLRLPRERAEVRWKLGATFATYVAPYVAGLILIASLPVLVRLGSPLDEPSQLTTLGWVGAALASVGCLASPLGAAIALVRGRSTAPWLVGGVGDSLLASIAVLVRGLSALVLLWLVWDLRVDALFHGFVIAGLVATSTLWRRPPIVLGRLVVFTLELVGGRAPRPPSRPRPWMSNDLDGWRPRDPGSVDPGEAMYASIQAARRNTWSFRRAAWIAVLLAYLPMVVAFWCGAIGGWWT